MLHGKCVIKKTYLMILLFFQGDDREKLAGIAGYNENDKRNLNINTFSSRTCNKYNGNETTYVDDIGVNLLCSQLTDQTKLTMLCCENECIFAKGYAEKRKNISEYGI